MKIIDKALWQKDLFFLRLNEHEDFLAALKELDGDTVWDDNIRLAEVQFESPLVIQASELSMGDEDVLRDTADNEGGVIAVLPDGRKLAMRSYLWKQVKQHHRDTAPILGDMISAGALTSALEHINSGRAFLKNKTVKMMTRGNKVSGWFGLYNHDLGQSAQTELLESSLKATFPDMRFSEGSVSHYYTIGEYILDSSIATSAFGEASLTKGSVMSAYADAWSDAGMDASEFMKATPRVRFVTGESGLTGITLAPYLTIGGKYIPLGPALSVNHRGGDEAVWGQFEEFPGQVCVQFQNGLQGLERLCKRVVAHPYACTTRVLKQFAGSVPIALLTELAENVKVFYDPDAEDSTCRAIDIFNFVSELVNSANAGPKSTPIKRLSNLELLARLLVSDWGKLDNMRPVRLSGKPEISGWADEAGWEA